MLNCFFSINLEAQGSGVILFSYSSKLDLWTKVLSLSAVADAIICVFVYFVFIMCLCVVFMYVTSMSCYVQYVTLISISYSNRTDNSDLTFSHLYGFG